MKKMLSVLLAALFVFAAGAASVPAQAEAAFTTTPMLAEVSGSHSLALHSNGTVWAWGANNYGQLGDGSATNRSVPVQTQGLSGITAIAGGGYHSFALHSDGTVWAWGRNNSGQLGDGSTTNRSVPVQIQGLSGMTAIAAGIYFSLALKSDGTVWTWGRNNDGQLGDGSTTNRSMPVQVLGLSDVAAIAAHDYHSLVLKRDGTVWAWGNNNYGQLGDGSTTNRKTPVQVLSLNGVTAITAGNYESLALKNDGTVWAWGRNSTGQLGNGSTTDSSVPLQVSGLSGITSIAAGAHVLALHSNGIAWAWGYNSVGQLGDGNGGGYIYSTVPVQVQGLTDLTIIAAGGAYSLAMKNDGTVWAWGHNDTGKLGDGSTRDRRVPVQVLCPCGEEYFSLVEHCRDKTALNALLVQASAIVKGDSTDASWNALQNAIAAAQAVADDWNATQAQVGAQIAALQSAMDGLVEKEDPPPPTKYVGLFGRYTSYEAKPLNWILFIVFFGWVWMWF